MNLILYIIMPSICLCATEVRALYGLRLPATEVGGAQRAVRRIQ